MRIGLSKAVRWFWWAVGIILTIMGFAGIPDDLATWSVWINRMVNDPFVLDLAERAVTLAEFVNQFWIRAVLVVVGIMLMVWPLRWFWRFRHKLKFRWRRLMVDQVWISKKDSKLLIKNSAWGRLMEPNVVQSVSVFDSLTSGLLRERVVHGMSDTQKALLKFDHYMDQTLENFCEANPAACRVENGSKEMDEAPLRAFLKMAMDEELSDEFGDAPKFKVT